MKVLFEDPKSFHSTTGSFPLSLEEGCWWLLKTTCKGKQDDSGNLWSLLWENITQTWPLVSSPQMNKSTSCLLRILEAQPWGDVFMAVTNSEIRPNRWEKKEIVRSLRNPQDKSQWIILQQAPARPSYHPHQIRNELVGGHLGPECDCLGLVMH